MKTTDVVHRHALIDELLEARRNLFAAQDLYDGYRSHAYRMLNFARQWIEPHAERDDKLAVCGVFHDIDAFPNGNLDYLKPSADAAERWLDQTGRSAWKSEMRLMIEWHHKLTPYRAEKAEWVEAVRRADWCDISFRLMRFGLPKAFVNDVNAAFPLRSFYPGHVYKVTFKWMLSHPLNPAPILRW